MQQNVYVFIKKISDLEVVEYGCMAPTIPIDYLGHNLNDCG